MRTVGRTSIRGWSIGCRYPSVAKSTRAGWLDVPGLEVLAGIVAGPVLATRRRGATWSRLLLHRIRVAAVPPAERNAVIGKLFPVVRQRPVPELDPVAGAQRLAADYLPVDPAGRFAAHVV